MDFEPQLGLSMEINLIFYLETYFRHGMIFLLNMKELRTRLVSRRQTRKLIHVSFIIEIHTSIFPNNLLRDNQLIEKVKITNEHEQTIL